MVLHTASDVIVRDLAENLPRRVVRTVHAESMENVRQAVLEANRTGVPIYPISRGLNWGLGSRAPVRDDCMLLDLSRMKKIRHLDVDTGYAVIEPGVSQGELSDRLLDTPYLLNVTTSCRDSSIIGNALDRGQGMLRLRIHDLSGFEVVLGTGEVITTGGTEVVAGHPYCGLTAGPDLSRLFCQSNFGVATAATISLVRRPECTSFVYGHFEGAAMPRLVDLLVRLRRDGLFRSIVYLSEMQVDVGAKQYPDFTALLPLLGRRKVVEAAEEIVRDELGRMPGCKSVRVGLADEVKRDDPLYVRARMFLGIPTCEMIRNRFGTPTCELDETSRLGWSVVQTLLPQDGKSVDDAMQVLQSCVDQYRLPAQPHFSTVSSRAINLMTMIWFERTPGVIERMRQMRDHLREELSRRGYQPSREGIDALRIGNPVAQDPGLKRIKAALDPSGIIAPGRYV